MPDSTLRAAQGLAKQAARGRAAGALENITNNFSRPPRDLDPKWAKLEWLRSESTLKRQRLCLLRSYALNVDVRQGLASIGFAGLAVCGSRLCPVCGPRIAARNRDDVVQAVRAWREGEGGTVLFGTFTLRHHKGQSFEELKEAVSAGWHGVTRGNGWVSNRRRHGVEHWLRVFEEKWSPDTGWHLHVHYLVFISAPTGHHHADPHELLQSMFGRWRSAVVRLGLGTPVLDGQDLHEVTGDNADEVLGDYFTKQIATNEARTAEQIGQELTNRDGKFRFAGRGAASLTPGELLTLSVAGDEQSRLLWGEYERGMLNRRVIAWSKGLRARVGIGDELSDEEAAELEGQELLTTVLQMRARAWRTVAVRRGMRMELLRRVWRDGAESAVVWLSENGVQAVLGTFDTWGEDIGQQNGENGSDSDGAGADGISLHALPF